MKKQSAGLLLFRRGKQGIEVLIVHPGGPFWAKKDAGSWSIPKGEFDGEEPLVAAKREFAEETGMPPPEGDYAFLGEFKQPSGKLVHAFILESDCSLEGFQSNMFSLEWPPKSGKMQEFPECDKAAWVMLDIAAGKLTKGQLPLLQALADKLGTALVTSSDPDGPPTAVNTSLSEPTERPGQTSLF